MYSNTLQILSNEGQPELAFLDSPKHQKHWRKGHGRGHSIRKGGCTLQNKSQPFSQLMRSIRGKPCFISYNAVTRPSLKIFPSSQSISETSPPIVNVIRGLCPAEIHKQKATWSLQSVGDSPTSQAALGTGIQQTSNKLTASKENWCLWQARLCPSSDTRV